MKAKTIIISILLFLSLISINIGDIQTKAYIDYEDALIERYIDIPIVAVTTDSSMGIIGRARVALLKESHEKVVFDKRTNIDSSTFDSIQDAILFAETLTGKKGFYLISYDLNSGSVSGHSTGASIAIAAISLLDEKTLNTSVIITGSIDRQGNFKETGGIPIKVFTAGKLGYKKMIIPKGQSMIQIYEKHSPDNFSSHNYYLIKEINLQDYAKFNFGMELIEADNLKNMLGIFMK